MIDQELLAQLKYRDPDTWYKIYQSEFNKCSYPDGVIIDIILKTIDKKEIPVQLSNLRDPGPYFAICFPDDMTNIVGVGTNWANAITKMYLNLITE